MESKYNVCIQIGLQTSLEFEAVFSKELSKDGMTYVEIDREGMLQPDRGMLKFDNGLRKIAIAYFGFKMMLDVLSIKTVGSNHHFRCATDLARVDVYVCTVEEWASKKEAIFF